MQSGEWIAKDVRPENAPLIAAAPELLESGTDLNALVLLAQGVINRYLPPDGITLDQAINELIELFDGPKQREAQRKWHAAIAHAEGRP